MYCIVRCPYCKNLQGGSFPVKKTRCQVCSKQIDLQKVGPVGIFPDSREMQANLIAMKWKGDDVTDLMRNLNDDVAFSAPTKSHIGRDGLRKTVLDILDNEMKREDIISFLIEEGNERELIESVIEELLRNGLLYYPRFDIIRKS